MPGDATFPKRFFFRDNFVKFIFRRRSKRIAFFGISEFFYLCVYAIFFNFRPSGAYICLMPGHRLPRLAKGTPTVSAFHRYHWFGVKLFPVACVQYSRRVSPKREKCRFLPARRSKRGNSYGFEYLKNGAF